MADCFEIDLPKIPLLRAGSSTGRGGDVPPMGCLRGRTDSWHSVLHNQPSACHVQVKGGPFMVSSEIPENRILAEFYVNCFFNSAGIQSWNYVFCSILIF